MNEQTKEKKTHRYREQTGDLGVGTTGRMGSWVKKEKGLRSEIGSHDIVGDVKYSVGNRVNNIVVTTFSAK